LIFTSKNHVIIAHTAISINQNTSQHENVKRGLFSVLENTDPKEFHPFGIVRNFILRKLFLSTESTMGENEMKAYFLN